MLSALGSDIPSSIVVFLVALPLCLGIALGSGAPLFSGIIAGVVGGIVIGILSGSQLSVSGPAAGLTAIVAGALGKLPVYEAFLLAVVIGGMLQLLLGFLRAGVLGDYIPSAVIRGMLAAIGLILIMKQFPHLIGYDTDFEGDETFSQDDGRNTFSGIFRALNYVLPSALIVGGISLILMIVWDKLPILKKGFMRLIPAPLVVVLMAVGINAVLLSSYPQWAIRGSHLVKIPVAESPRAFLGLLTLPAFEYISNAQVWITGLTLAIVASLESLLSIEAADELDPLHRVTPTNRELKAQGIGNIVSGMIGGLPLTSVIVRTSANISSGARTKMSSILHGFLLLGSVMFIPGLLNMIPLPALAAILIYTGYKLAKVSIFMEFYRKGWDQFVPFVITILAILLTDLLIGIVIGCVIGLFFVLRSNFRSAVLVVHDQNNYLFRLRKDVSFLNKPIVKNRLEKVPANASVIIDTSRADFIDQDVIEVIEDFMKHAHLKNITVDLKQNLNGSQGFKPLLKAV